LRLGICIVLLRNILFTSFIQVRGTGENLPVFLHIRIWDPP
jgi:hypothetical protein